MIGSVNDNTSHTTYYDVRNLYCSYCGKKIKISVTSNTPSSRVEDVKCFYCSEINKVYPLKLRKG